MSYTVTKFVLDLSGLTPSEKAVAHSLAYHAHSDGTESYPSMTTIASEAGLKNRRNAQRVVRQLEEKGVIVAETAKSGGRYKSTHYRFNLENCVPTDTLSVEASKQTASLQVGNSVSTGQKQRPYGRTKDHERSMKENNNGADRAVYSSVREDPHPFWQSEEADALDPDGSIREQLWDQEQIIRSIPLGLTQWIFSLQPPRLGSSPLAEADAVKAFKAMSELLVNGAAILFNEKRGSRSTLIDYDRIWRLDEKYGAGTTEALAKEIVNRGVSADHSCPISVRTFVWTHLADQLLDAPPS